MYGVKCESSVKLRSGVCSSKPGCSRCMSFEMSSTFVSLNEPEAQKKKGKKKGATEEGELAMTIGQWKRRLKWRGIPVKQFIP